MEKKGVSRREALIAGGAALAGGALLLTPRGGTLAQDVTEPRGPHRQHPDNREQSRLGNAALPPGEEGKDYLPVVVPNGTKLPWKIVDGVKVFHLVAEEVTHEFAPGLKASCWGYNGSVHGPLIEAVEGDHVRIFVTNRLKTPTTVHWHGILLPNGMDGVGGLNQKAIRPGETFKYEFTLRQSGMGMYHSHHDEMTQIGMGMTGLFVIHARKKSGAQVDRDFAILLHEWRIDPGTSRPNPNEMTDFNILTMNAKVFPATEPLVVKLGERVRIRLGNLGPMDHHPIHLHGYQFLVTETDGGRIPESAQWPETTVLVPVGSTRTIEFVANEPGDWAIHCHMTHHVMNQMGHEFPNMIGVKPKALDRKVQPLLPDYMTMGQDGMGDMAEMGMRVPENSIPMVGGAGKHDYITMGGMFTVVKVRKDLAGYKDPGWYENPPNTLACAATSDELVSGAVVDRLRIAPYPLVQRCEQLLLFSRHPALPALLQFGEAQIFLLVFASLGPEAVFSSFSKDGFATTKFDYLLANPPFGVEWKPDQDFIEKEHETQGMDGRFGAGTVFPQDAKEPEQQTT